MRYALLGGALLFVILGLISRFPHSARAASNVDQTQFPPNYVPSGREIYRQFCAACHGADANTSLEPASERQHARRI